MATKLIEHTYGLATGAHIFMRIQMDNGRVEEIDVFIDADGHRYFTSADPGMEEANPEASVKSRQAIIDAFHELY